MYDGEESLHAACRQSGRKGGAPMEVAKIGGPTGIEGSLGCLLSSHPHVETAARWLHVFAYLGEPRGDSVVALAIC
jgi:hypothetical protein